MNVLITGASKGLGLELVKQFATDTDNNIVALSRDLKLLKSLEVYCHENYNNSIHTYSIDFLSNNFNRDLGDVLSDHNYHFDIIINNAGYLINKPFIDSSVDDIYRIFKTNVFAPIHIMRALIPLLDKNRSCHIINIGSMGGFQGSAKFPGLSIYSSSKAALANLTECLAEEYKDFNIKINCLALGSVQTEMLNQAFPGFEAQMSPEEMANYIHQFSCQDPLYFNGKIIPVSNTTP